MAGGAASGSPAIRHSSGLTESLKRAFGLAAQRRQRQVTAEHLLAGLLDDGDCSTVIVVSGVDVEQLRRRVVAHVDALPDRLLPGEQAEPVASPELIKSLEYAGLAARQSNRATINGAIVLAAIVGEGRTQAAQILKTEGLTFETAIRALQSADVAPPADPAPYDQASREAPPEEGEAHDGWLGQDEDIASARGEGPTTDEVITEARNRIRLRTAERQQSHPHEVSEVHETAVAESVTSAENVDPSHADVEPPSISSLEEVPAARSGLSQVSRTQLAEAPPYEEPLAETPAVGAPPRPPSRPPGRPQSTLPPEPSDSRPFEPAREQTASQLQPIDIISRPPPMAPPRDLRAPPEQEQQPAARPGRPMPEMAQRVSPPLARGTSNPPPRRADATSIEPRRDLGERPPVAVPPVPPQTGPERTAHIREMPAVNSLQRGPPHDDPSARPRSPTRHQWPLRRDGHPGAVTELAQAIATLPTRLKLGEPQAFEVRMSRRKLEDLASGMTVVETGMPLDGGVACAVSLRLRCVDGTCAVETISPETQWFARSTGGDPEELVVWRWRIVPMRPGSGRLQVIIAGRSISLSGRVSELVLPERTASLRVVKGLKRRLRVAVLGFGLVALGLVIGLYGRTMVVLGHLLVARLIGN